MRPHVGYYLHLQWNKKIVQLRYKDFSTCIHLTTIKTFWELQMESKYLTPNQLTMKFYWNFTSLVFTLILSWLSYLHEVCVVPGTCRFSLLIIHQVSMNLKYMYLWKPLLLINPFLFLFWCKTIPGVLSDDWQQVSSIWKPKQTSNVVHKTEGEKLKRTCEEKLNWSTNMFLHSIGR